MLFIKKEKNLVRIIAFILTLIIISTKENIKYNNKWKIIGNVEMKYEQEKYKFEFKKCNECNEERHDAKEDKIKINSAILNSFNLEKNEGITIIFEPQLNNDINKEFSIILNLNSIENIIKSQNISKSKDLLKFDFLQSPNNSFLVKSNNKIIFVQASKLNKTKIKIFHNSLILYNNNNIMKLKKFMENEKLYFCLITSSSDFIINDLQFILHKKNDYELINQIKTSKFIYEYNILDNYITYIKIKSENIQVNLLKDKNCNFDKSYIIYKNKKYKLLQSYKNDYILLKPFNQINKASSFIPIIECDNIPQEKLICKENNEENDCYFNNKIIKKKKLRKLENDNYIIITCNGNIGDEVLFISNLFDILPNKVELNGEDVGGNIRSVELNKNGENKIKAIWNERISTTYQMFQNCSSLLSLDLSHFDTSSVTNMANMFQFCSSLISLDLSNLKTDLFTNMVRMFRRCSSLTSLDLSNFATSSGTEIYCMFESCSSLISLDLSKFNTSSVTDLGYIFAGCYSLISLDLSNFNTSLITNMQKMFQNCRSLISLDLSNFDTSKVTNMDIMFQGCSSLKYLNLLNSRGSDIFNTIPNSNNLLICMNNYDNLPDSHSLIQKNAINNCSNICFQKPTILNIENENCYYNC